jgi:hypothetical protein
MKMLGRRERRKKAEVGDPLWDLRVAAALALQVLLKELRPQVSV